MHFIRTEIDDSVLMWFRVAREHVAKLGRLFLSQLLCIEAGEFAVGDAPHAIVADSRRHVPVHGVDDEVGVFPAEFGEVVVCLGCGNVSVN